MSNQLGNPQLAAEAQRISRDYDVLKTQYDKLLQDREQLRLRGQVETERNSVKFQVVDPPRAPFAPNRPLLLFGELIVGLGAGAAAAFAVGQLRATFSTSSRLESAIGLPVLGTITEVLNEASRELRRRRQRQFFAGAGALVGIFALLLVFEMIQVGMVA